MYIRNTKQDISKLLDFRKSFQYVSEIKNIVKGEFEVMKAELIAEFDKHEVTEEIEAGPSASNTSGTLGGVGNLFTFIGFEANQKPTEPIRQALQHIFLTSTMVKRDGSSESHVLYPSPDDIFRVTPLPWAQGRSWARGIESGLSGLGHYLNKESDLSRSSKGIQVDNIVRGGKFQNTQYITAMIRSFEKKLKSLNKIVA
jgi:hypothetical protein